MAKSDQKTPTMTEDEMRRRILDRLKGADPKAAPEETSTEDIVADLKKLTEDAEQNMLVQKLIQTLEKQKTTETQKSNSNHRSKPDENSKS